MSDSIIPPDATVHELRVEQTCKYSDEYPFAGMYKTLNAITVNRDDWAHVLRENAAGEWEHLADVAVQWLFEPPLTGTVPVWIGAGAQISLSVSEDLE